MSVSKGDKYEVSFPGSGVGSATGAKYEVYYVSGTAKNVPSSDQIVYLKLIDKKFFQVGVPFIVSIPLSELGQFMIPSTSRT